MSNLYRILFIVPYFGEWPEWMELHLDSIKRNPTIDFLFITDCETSVLSEIKNVRVQKSAFETYIHRFKKVLDKELDIPNPYKLCDLRPLFGLIHNDIIKNYDFYGWTDMDILFGNIREFYTDAILSKYDVLSTHAHTISGHMALFRNNRKNREMYKNIYDWEGALQNAEFVGIDEHGITNAYLYTFWDKVKFKSGFEMHPKINDFFKKQRKKRMYMIEQFTTPFTPLPWIDGSMNSNQPSTWFYKDGEITNSRDGSRKFMYLHFMNFKSSKWRHDGTPAPWEKLENYVNAEPQDMERGIRIDKEGISQL